MIKKLEAAEKRFEFRDVTKTDVTTKGTSVYYYAQGYREQGNNLYVNYGQDAEGLLVTVKEIRQ